jgi:hypothetical protein
MIIAGILLAIAPCPLIHQATVAGILGVPVTANGCDFVGRDVTLHLEMLKDFKRCPDAVPLKGLGSEAFACGDEIVVRVREKAFLVRTKEREKARKVAESIAGSLF